jgi:fumarate hydratase subunit alpha
MKEVSETLFREKLKNAIVEASFNLREDIKGYFQELLKKIDNDNYKQVVSFFIENFSIAFNEKRALCQDTGYVEIFFEIGQDVHIGFDLKKTCEDAVKEVFEKYYLRKSLADPLTKENTKNNLPVFFDFDFVKGDRLKVVVLLKGGGSENATRILSLNPSYRLNEIEEKIVDSFKEIGSKACPPYIAGICIGANFEKALNISKKLLLYKISENPMSKTEYRIAKELKEKINLLGIGFGGLKFGETLIDLKLKIVPSHIATLPVAISIGCNSVRQASFEL